MEHVDARRLSRFAIARLPRRVRDYFFPGIGLRGLLTDLLYGS